MAQDTSTSSNDVVEWGTDDAPRRGRLAALAGGLGIRQQHLAVAAAAAGAGLAGLSLLTHWQVTELSEQFGPPDADVVTRVETYLAGLGAWGSGYLFGLLGLLALTAVTLYGAPGTRRQLRFAGLGWAGGLLALLLAAVADLDRTSAVLGNSLFGQEPDYELSLGPGPTLALAGVAMLTGALYLSDRGTDPGEPAAAGAGATAGGRPGAPAARRPGAGTDEVADSQPADLTVTPAVPFVHLPETYER